MGECGIMGSLQDVLEITTTTKKELQKQKIHTNLLRIFKIIQMIIF